MGIGRVIYCKLAHKNKYLDILGEAAIYSFIALAVLVVALFGPVYHRLVEHKRLINKSGHCWICDSAITVKK